MKKVIMLMMLTALTVNIYALQKQVTESSADTIIVRTDPTNPNPAQGSGPRGLDISIYICQNGHLLEFEPCYSGCVVMLVDKNEHIEYSGIVGSDGIVVLPEYLEGVFELQLTVDNIVYSGEIQLE